MKFEKLYDSCLHLAFLMRQQAIIGDAEHKKMIYELQKEFKDNQEEIKKLDERITLVEAIWGYV